ncbi:hypothetical protein GCM10009673_22740 [Nesterenkonia sandarakina]|nr:hypothetical protein [Nesterenkonia sandarakina]
MTDPAPTSLEALSASIVDAVSDLPGVDRLVPSFKEALTASTKEFFGAGDSQARVVDIVTEDDQTQVFIDLYTDGSRPAGDVVDDIHRAVHGILDADSPSGESASTDSTGADSTGADSTGADAPHPGTPGSFTLRVRVLGVTRGPAS